MREPFIAEHISVKIMPNNNINRDLHLPSALIVLFAMLGPITILVARGLPFMLTMIGIFAFVQMIRAGHIKLQKPSTPILALIAFFVYASTATFWSLYPQLALEQVFQFLLTLLPLLVMLSYVKRLHPLALHKASAILRVSFLVAVLLLVIELFFDHPVYKFFLYILSYAPEGSFGSGEIDKNTLHRSLAIMSVMIFMLAAQFPKFKKRRMVFILPLLWLVLTYYSPSQSAFVGTLIGILATGFAFLQRKLTHHMLGIGLAACFIFAVPLSIANYKTDFAENYLNKGIMKESHITQRSETYYGISKQILEKPVFGHGLEASRLIETLVDEQTGKNLFFSLHPHNFVLQILLETGYVGGFLFWLAFYIMLARLRQYNTALHPLMYGAISSAVVISLFAFGFWQTWWQAGLVIIFIAFMQELYKSQATPSPPSPNEHN